MVSERNGRQTKNSTPTREKTMKKFAVELHHISNDSKAFAVEIRLAEAREYYNNVFKQTLIGQAIKGKTSLILWGQNTPKYWGDILPMLVEDGFEVARYTNDTPSHSVEWVIRW